MSVEKEGFFPQDNIDSSNVINNSIVQPVSPDHTTDKSRPLRQIQRRLEDPIYNRRLTGGPACIPPEMFRENSQGSRIIRILRKLRGNTPGK